MLNEKEVLIQFDRYGILNAVKYVKTETGFGLKECKYYVDRLVRLRADFDPTKGTIAWFNCADSLPPLVELEYTSSYFSEEVLTTDGLKVKAMMYHYTRDNEPLGWACPANYIPTHWAYINYPEQA